MREESPEQRLVNDLLDWMNPASLKEHFTQSNGHAVAAPLTDEQIIERCRAGKSAAKFSDLFDAGAVSAYDDDASGADYGLLGILKHHTRDPRQIERIMRLSALRRAKWDEDRVGQTWLRYSIDNSLKDVGEVYDWPRERPRPLSSSPTSPVPGDDDDNSSTDNTPEIVWFAELGEPKEREFLIEKVGVKGYPVVAFGAGGVAKSFAMLSAGIAIASASGVEDWLGLRVLEHGYVLYLDFELDLEEQHRRVRDLCKGMGIPIPKRLAYLSGVGISPESAFRAATKFVEEHEAKAVIIDSMGLAMQGDMDKSQEVLAFHANCVNPLRRAGATPLIVDHEGKLQPGEKHKDKSPHGSAFKAWAARSVLQFVFEEFREESSQLDIRVRQSKANFTSRMDPIGVRFTFEEKKVTIGGYELPDEELVDEESRPVRERILAALRLEGATIKQLVQITGATEGTIRNKLSELRGEHLITDNGRKPATYELLSSSPPGTGGIDDDDNSATSVAELFANPPAWLPRQLEVYRENPERYFEQLCNTVAAVVLGDPLRGDEVAEEVRAQVLPPTRVVNYHTGDRYEVNIMRGPGGTVPKSGPGIWGNPFEVGADKDGTLEEVLEKYRRYMLEGGVQKYDGTTWDGRHLLPLIPTEIKGKVLGCACAPKGGLTADDPLRCHGQILARLADEA